MNYSALTPHAGQGERPFGLPADLANRTYPYPKVSFNITNSDLSCCGVTTFKGFTCAFPLTEFADKAAWLAALWRVARGMRHYVYILNDNQNSIKNYEPGALRECGAELVATMPNMQPGHGNQLYLYVVDLNVGIGKFFDSSGVPYTEPPVVISTRSSNVIVKPSSFVDGKVSLLPPVIEDVPPAPAVAKKPRKPRAKPEAK